MSYTLEKFGTTYLPTAAPTVDVGSGPSRLSIATTVSGEVWDADGAGQAVRAQTTINCSGLLTGTDMKAIQTAHQGWLALRGTRNTLWRLFADGTRQWCYARLVQVSGTRTTQHRQHLPVSFSFLMLSRDWYSESESSHDYADLLAIDEDLMTVGAEGDLTAYPLTVTINNPGDQLQPNVTITVQAGTGTISEVKIENITTGHSVTFTGDIESGERLVLDCGAHSCLLYPFIGNAAGAYDDLTVASRLADWFALQPGDNDIEISLTEAGTGTLVTVEYYGAHG